MVKNLEIQDFIFKLLRRFTNRHQQGEIQSRNYFLLIFEKRNQRNYKEINIVIKFEDNDMIILLNYINLTRHQIFYIKRI